jgi:hypothetical protein
MDIDISGFTEPYGTDNHVRNGMLSGVKGDRNILQAINRWTANRIGHILRSKCLLKHFIGGKIEGITSDGKRRKKT